MTLQANLTEKNMYKKPYKKNNNYKYKQPSQYILPPVSLLEEYESLVPGSSEKIIDMVDVEQDHRHRWENKALRAYVWSYRLGQCFAFISLIIILYTALYSLQVLNNPNFAFTIIGLGFILHITITILSIKRKKFFERPRKSHPKSSPRTAKS